MIMKDGDIDELFLIMGFIKSILICFIKKRLIIINFISNFEKSVLITFVKHFNTKVDILMERLRTLADGKKTIKLFPEMNHLTLDAIAIVLAFFNL